MAGGWSRDGAVQDQIDASIDDAIKEARSRLGSGSSATECEVCDTLIPEARRKALPGVRLCVACQQEQDDKTDRSALFNRRGSKDSQLR